MNILGLIPARGGSKGIPKKNIRLLGGKPLIQYTIESANKAANLKKTIVSTDSCEIAKIAEELGAFVPFIRPERLSLDDTPTIEVILHAIDFFCKKGEFFDAVCLLQPTCPFRSETEIDAALNKFEQIKPDSLITVKIVPHTYNPHWVFEATSKDFLTLSTGEDNIIPRRQLLPKAFYRDGSIYITSINTLKKGSLYGSRICYLENYHKSINLDNELDWIEAEKLAKEICNE